MGGTATPGGVVPPLCRKEHHMTTSPEEPLSDNLKRKISNLCNVDEEAVVNAADARNIYELPLHFCLSRLAVSGLKILITR